MFADCLASVPGKKLASFSSSRFHPSSQPCSQLLGPCTETLLTLMTRDASYQGLISRSESTLSFSKSLSGPFWGVSDLPFPPEAATW